MVDLEKLKSEFWDGKYKIDCKDEKDKSKKETKQFYFDKDGIGIAIKRALGDFTDRTERLKTEYKGQPFGVDEKYNALCESSVPGKKSFVERFMDYFFPVPKSDNQYMDETSFDQWHKEMCEEFLAVIEPKYQGGLKYGKAQKIVNMTFKNAYCLQHNEIKEDQFEKYFEHCHIPLDSIILEWVKRTQAWLCSKDAENNDCKKKKAETLCSTRIPSWSKMNYEECPGFLTSDGKPYYGYKDIQNAIFEYFNKYVEKNTATKHLKGCTPLQAEFFVWKYMQLELAAEGVYNQFLSFEDLDNTEIKTKKAEYRNKTINEKIADLQKKLKNIEIYKVQE